MKPASQDVRTAIAQPSVQLSLLWVDKPIFRLASGTVARIFLLMASSLHAHALLFQGSDQTSAPAEQLDGANGVMVTCAARGSWGTCLPVVIAGAEQAPGTPGSTAAVGGADDKVPLVAVTVCTVIHVGCDTSPSSVIRPHFTQSGWYLA